MVRLYGRAPYSIILVHGGPGAIGSLKGFAQQLGGRSGMGVIEALQSQYTINGLIEELSGQISQYGSRPVSLVGHSWGAWLAALAAARYPELVQRVILVGCPPLTDRYVPEIAARRLQGLPAEDAAVFQRLCSGQAGDADMEKIPKILEKADNYCLEGRELHQADRADSRMHNLIWEEAARLRSSGELLSAFWQSKGGIYLIQGENDPHPAQGVRIPLEESGIRCEAHILKRCGHSPFIERYAREGFYALLLEILAQPPVRRPPTG